MIIRPLLLLASRDPFFINHFSLFFFGCFFLFLSSSLCTHACRCVLVETARGEQSILKTNVHVSLHSLHFTHFTSLHSLHSLGVECLVITGCLSGDWQGVVNFVLCVFVTVSVRSRCVTVKRVVNLCATRTHKIFSKQNININKSYFQQYSSKQSSLSLAP